MARVVVVEAHTIPERPPFRLAVGDVVSVGRRDQEWPAFVFVTGSEGSGWVPARHLSSESGRATAIAAYDTTELPTSVGDMLEVVTRDDEAGWLWCRSADGREGWVPARTVEPADE